MTTTPTPSRTRIALVSGAGTAAYYATPDLIRARPLRAWVKTGLLAAIAAGSLPDVRAAAAAVRAAKQTPVTDDPATAPTAPERTEDNTFVAEDATTEGAASGPSTLATLPTSGKVVGAAFAVLFLGASTALTVAAERWVFRRGEARAAAGVRLPHTRTGLLLGVLAAGLALVPSPDDARG